MTPDTALVKWDELSKDRECDGKKHLYKVNWREKGQEFSNVKTTKQQSFILKGL